jgi:hypothetical protein
MGEWTNEHCERCYGEDNPKLKTHEIWCKKHYQEWLEESVED